ncbi:MAG TPA: hypothetical protein VLT82_17760 [Myxococcaceae bacterium]|nr:hypothetical protein [Myxococcaceae bacterium]
MRIRGLTLSLALLGGLTACDTGRSGAITVSWTFGGGSCSGAGVEQVRIAIAGEPLDQDTFDCRSGLATFTNFYPGTYNVTVQGLDASQVPTWQGSNSVRVEGDVSVRVDLQPLSGQNAVAYLSWSFAPSTGQAPQCGPGQRIDYVGILVDDVDTGLAYNCGDGLGASQVITPYLAPGPHVLQLVAFNGNDGVSLPFARTDPVSVNFVTGQASAQSLTLRWQVGGLAMSWAAYADLASYQANPNQPLTCASTGIATVEVFLADPADPGNPQAGIQFSGFTCASGALLDNAPVGTWLPFVAGYDALGTLRYFQDDQSVPQTVTVTAGRFYALQDLQTQVFVPLFP